MTMQRKRTVTPESIQDAMSRIVREDISCEREGDGFRLETPYILTDGHLLEVYLEAGQRNGDFRVSDRSYATSQIELFVKSPQARFARFSEMRRIANELGLEWDSDFSYEAKSLTVALQKIAALAQGVDRALSLTPTRVSRVPQALDTVLAQRFRGYGLSVKRHGRILMRADEPSVSVGLHLIGKREAAVEVLSGETYTTYDHASANFAILRKGHWQGLLFAVYDEDAQDSSQLDRFRYICEDVPLLRSSETDLIREQIAA